MRLSSPAALTAPALTPEDELHWLALRLVPGLGTRRSRPTPRTLQHPAGHLPGLAQRTRSRRHPRRSGPLRRQRLHLRRRRHPAATHARRRCGTVPFGDPRYPEPLRRIYDPPPVLFARGRVELLSSICIGVVGTRHPTPYGIAAAERLSGDLARAGLTIASGMARGIDTAAHKACLAAGGATIAVLGCGVDIVYPSENRKLAAEIAAKGLIISEFPMGATAFPQNFPIRNRIISGLSCGLLVVEGAQYSGSAITARLAIEQGREVFAVPGNITSKMSWGPNLLIKQGAKLVQDWNDVVVELPQPAQRRLIDEGRQRIMNQGLGASSESSAGAAASEATDPDRRELAARRVLRQLKTDAATHLDTLVETSKTPRLPRSSRPSSNWRSWPRPATARRNFVKVW
jgi:DNA processing protein